MFLNLSNHPSTLWSAEQLSAAAQYGEIQDLPFPAIDPAADETIIDELVDQYFDEIIEISKGKNLTVHLMGEMTFTFALVRRLQGAGIACVASTSVRSSIEVAQGKKQIEFQFVRFRNYVS